MLKTSGLLLLCFTTITLTRASSAPSRADSNPRSKRTMLTAREIIDEDGISESYDYVIAGGGLAGLVLASRLSKTNNTVLVLEAGLSGDEVAGRINTPSGAYYSSIVGTEYDWAHVTVPQQNLNNRTISWPKGKILGGSSAMNAMYLVRPAEQELNAWQKIITSDDRDAATMWGWDEMYSAMKKSENFTEPRADVAAVGNIQWDASTHGSGGPMSVSYPGVMMQIVGNWTSSLNSIGVPSLPNPNGGVTLGGFLTPSSINPTNWTRSYSRSAYIDSLPPRANLHILPEATVTRLLFRDQYTADGWVADKVEFAKDAKSPKRTVRVRQEVILTGGSIGSPAILMHSGFGPRDVLEDVGIPVIEELPGVGQHLQDHLTAGVVWQSELETAGDIHDSNSDFSNSPEFRSFINDAVAFVNMTRLFGPAGAFGLRQQIQQAMESSTAVIPPTSDASVKEGYKVIYDLLTNSFYDTMGQVEFLMSVIGSGTVTIQAAPQHPYSQGRLWINSTDPFQPVLIDPGYYSHFADVIMMRQGIKVVRALGAAFGTSLGSEISPGSAVQTDQDIEAWLRNQGANSQFHPSSSCGMLPRAQGGVVDSKLRVYGAANVRVADTSVFPFIFAAHPASPTFGLAEQAAVLIQQESFTVPNGVKTSILQSFNVMMVCMLWAVVLLLM